MELDVDYGALQISILSIQSKTFSAYITRLHTVQVLSIAQVANLKLISEKRLQQTFVPFFPVASRTGLFILCWPSKFHSVVRYVEETFGSTDLSQMEPFFVNKDDIESATSKRWFGP